MPVLPTMGGADVMQKLMHMMFLGFMLLCMACKKVHFPKSYLCLSLIVAIGLSAYYTFNTLFFTKEIVVRDFGDLTRPIIYLTYTFFAFIFPLSEVDFGKLFKFLIKVVLFQIFISIFVYFPFLWPIVDIFKGRPSFDMPLHFYRWSGTFGYPSDFSFLLSFFIFYYYSLYVKKQSIKFKEWALVGLCFIALIMTFSRGGIFSTIGILGLSYFFTGAIKRKSSYVMLISGVVAISSAVIYFSEDFEQVAYMTSIVTSEDQKMDSSTGHRFKEMELAVEYSTKAPPFGAGSSRVELGKRIPIIESFYGFHLMKWGILGLLIILSIKTVIMLACLSVRQRKYKLDGTISSVAFAVILLTLSEVLLFGLSSAITDRFKCLPAYYLLVGYVFSFYFRKQHDGVQ